MGWGGAIKNRCTAMLWTTERKGDGEGCVAKSEVERCAMSHGRHREEWLLPLNNMTDYMQYLKRGMA